MRWCRFNSEPHAGEIWLLRDCLCFYGVRNRNQQNCVHNKKKTFDHWMSPSGSHSRMKTLGGVGIFPDARVLRFPQTIVRGPLVRSSRGNDADCLMTTPTGGGVCGSNAQNIVLRRNENDSGISLAECESCARRQRGPSRFPPEWQGINIYSRQRRHCVLQAIIKQQHDCGDSALNSIA